MIHGADLHVDRRGQSLVDHRIDQAAGLEVGGQLRHFAGDFCAARERMYS